MEGDMAHLRVGPDGYTHFWTKAGAHTVYAPHWEGTVKRAVLEGAIKAGKGEDMDADPAPVIHDLADLPELLPDLAPKPRRRPKPAEDDAA